MPKVPEVSTCVFCPQLSSLGSSLVVHVSIISRCAGGPLPEQTKDNPKEPCKSGSSTKPPNLQNEALWITIVAGLLSILVSILKLLELIRFSP